MNTLYVNGHIYTQDPALPRADAMLVTDGRVAWVGRAGELGTGVAAERVDLEGSTVIPALGDAHVHFMAYALLRQQVDLRGARSEEEAAQRVADYAARHPDRPWIRGHGWNEHLWEGGKLPTRASLDAVVPDRPVVLSRIDGHVLWVNTRALEAAGLTDETPNPPGGELVRDERGRLTGILRETARKLIHECLPAPSLSERVEALRQAQQEALGLGLVRLHVIEGPEALEAFQVLHAAGELAVRVLFLLPISALEHLRPLELRAGFGDSFLRLGQLKIFADGTLGSRTAWMLEPFEHEPENRGMPIYTSEELNTLVREAHKAGWPCAIHAIGDAANRAALDAIEQAPPCGSSLPDRIEHVQIIHPDDMPRLRTLDVVASMQPIHMASDWRLADYWWGARARWSYAWRSLRRLGTALAFGSDAPVEPLDPWPALAVAITRRDLNDLPEGGWYPDETLTLAEVLEGFTVGVARAAGDPRGGRLVPGAPADFLVLDQNPFDLAPEALARLRPRMTVVGGWG